METMHTAREIDELLTEIRAAPSVKVTYIGDRAMVLKCSLSRPRRFDRKHIETALNVQLPNALLNLWKETAELRLFEDINFGQWGLVIWPAGKLIKKNRQVVSDRPDEYRLGDLVIGEFLGDGELAVLRCDPTSSDYGAVLISLPIYPRQDWYVAADSLVAFLKRFVSVQGKKYWESI